MIYPDQNKFEELKESFNRVPICKVVSGDTETPITLFRKLAKGKSFSLESGEGSGNNARYSYIGRDPFLRIESRGEKILIEDNGIQKEFQGRVLEKTEELLKEYSSCTLPDFPDFLGGAVGYIGYDILNQYNNIIFNQEEDVDLPEVHLLFTREIIVYDHFHQKIIIAVNTDGNDYRKALLEIDKIEKEIKESISPEEAKIEEEYFEIESNISKEEFIENVIKAKEYISKGEIDQVVLSQRFEVKTSKTPFEAYRDLRSLNPSPYMYYLDFEDYQIVGSSPEILVKVSDRSIETCPIAGTRPRGKTKEEDERRMEDLLSDPKELKEHMMLVEVAKEDLSKISSEESIYIAELKKIKKYSHVMHIVSLVKSELMKELSSMDALISCLPAGTVSGYPKLRAMEIIEELENKKRGIYAGAVGYIGFNGNMDLAIAIRTIIFEREKAYIQAGAGIVDDSVSENEFYETVSKSKALVEILKSKETALSRN